MQRCSPLFVNKIKTLNECEVGFDGMCFEVMGLGKGCLVLPCCACEAMEVVHEEQLAGEKAEGK